MQIDRLNLEGYSNLDTWVSDFDKRIERVLVGRLEAVIDVWCAQLSREDDGETRSSRANEIQASATTVQDKSLSIRPIQHEVCIRNQVIYLDPPVEQARADWYAQLQTWLGASQTR